MITINNLSKAYGSHILFRDLTSTINSREKIGLVGRNGHGKTTLFQMILGEIEPDSGEICIPGDYRIGHMAQIISFSHTNVLDEACSGLLTENKNDIWKAKKVLTGLGYTKDDFSRDPMAFSRGYQIRLNLAKVLLSDPDLLLLDEPNNYLDILSIRWLTNFLNSWTKELLLITHDRSFMDSITTHTMIIHRNTVRKFKGGTEKGFRQITEEETIHEKTRLNFEKKRQRTYEYIRRFRAKARMAKSVQSSIKALEKQKKLVKLEKIKKLDFFFNSAPLKATQLLSLNNISFSYDKEKKPLIDNLNIDIRNGERICVIGKNGKGKSTLLAILAGKLIPDSGFIKSHPKLKAGYYAESDIIRLNDHRSVYEEIISTNTDCQTQQVRNICGTLMFEGDDALKTISMLSGGEKSRVLLGRLLATPSNLLLLDEPTNHLDMESCDAILAAIEEFKGTVILVTHNEEFINSTANRLIVFNGDDIRVFEGTYRDFLEDIGWDEEKQGSDYEDNKICAAPRKSIKKLQARIRQERSRVLKPIEDKLDDYEKKITVLENELDENTQIMIKASRRGDPALIAETSKKDSYLRGKIDELFHEFEETTLHYEKECLFFEKKLKKTNKSD